MSTWLRMLVICGITAAACVNIGSSDEETWSGEAGRSRSERTTSSRTDAGLSVVDSGAGSAQALRDAGSFSDLSDRRGMALDTESDAEADSDDDAGFPELAAPVLRDCAETLRCDMDRRTTLEACITSTTSVLASATPAARQRFLAIVMRCSRVSGCDYVSCTLQP
jgi:hypothetical protein